MSVYYRSYATAVTLGECRRKTIQYIFLDKYCLCPKYLRLCTNGFHIRCKSPCGCSGSGHGNKRKTLNNPIVGWPNYPIWGWRLLRCVLNLTTIHPVPFQLSPPPFIWVVGTLQGWAASTWNHPPYPLDTVDTITNISFALCTKSYSVRTNAHRLTWKKANITIK